MNSTRIHTPFGIAKTLWFLFIGFLTGGLSAQADVITEDMTVDTYLSSGLPTATYLDTGTTVLMGYNAAGQDTVRALFKSTVANIPASSVVVSATLHLYQDLNTGLNESVDIFRMLTDWSDNATWDISANGMWDADGLTSGVDYQALATDTASTPGVHGVTEFDVTADVADWYAGTASNFGWVLRNQSEVDSNDLVRFRTIENGDFRDPQLVITYQAVPEPTSLALIGLGVLSAAMTRRHTIQHFVRAS